MSETTELIRRLTALGLRQTEISERAKVPQSRLSRWKNAINVPPSCDDAIRLFRLVNEVETERKAPDEVTVRPEG